ncbi:MAG: hypothetical protein ABS949_06360 [Solibacillus sp.]
MKNMLRYVWMASNAILYVLSIVFFVMIFINADDLKATGEFTNWLFTAGAVFLFAMVGTLRIRRTIKSGQI